MRCTGGLTGIMVLFVPIIILLVASNTASATGIPVRHEPYELALLVKPSNNLVDTIKEVEEKVADTDLEQILGNMRDAVEKGDPDEYNRAASMLAERLISMNASQLVLSQEDLKLLASLAASTASGYGYDFKLETDPEKYASLLDFLAKSGILDKEAVPLDNIASIRDLSEVIEGAAGRNSFAFSSPTSILNMPSLPKPVVGTKGISKLRPGFSLRSFAQYIGFSSIVIAIITLIYLNRHRLIGLSREIKRTRTLTLYERAVVVTTDLRGRVIKCYNALINVLSLLGYPKHRWETPREYMDRLKDTGYGSVLTDATTIYEKAAYSPKPISMDDLDRCMECLKRLRES